ncbi:D-lactaldehyde dehydrogenase [Coprinopsis sp. MPI-PUGE-AT-0042]|nr:D-lactaldehyde dehydrogenase [Coprinopsis sp. MPI-PUGE-AT-0042]
MPAIASNDKVLVTGANGFVALWIVKTLLERGNSVRAAVRSDAKGRNLQKLFSSYGNKLEICIVPDMTSDGAWNDAVQGVQAIAHTATPVDFSNPKPQPEDFIVPATRGTVGILESALKFRGGLKRIVITSSSVTVANFWHPPRLYTEEDWNEAVVEEVKSKGAEAGVEPVYSASKTLAEKAAWDFYEKHKYEVGWDMSVTLPPLVFGPTLGEASSPEALNASVKWFWDFVAPGAPQSPETLGAHGIWVDVRDLAEAHVLALEKEKAAGERILTCAGSYVWQDFVDAAYKLNLPGRNISPGFPDLSRETDLRYSSKKSDEILGLKYRSKEETTRDSLEDFSQRGF